MSKQLRLPTLLVVTDNPTIRFWIKKHLDEDFFILNADKESEARAALNTRLDLILVDAALTDCDALDLCRQINQLTKKNLIPIFLITGRLKKTYRDRAQASGVTAFLSDQLDVDELKTCISESQKTAQSREKIIDISASIKPPQLSTLNSSLKDKFVLNDAALKLLSDAKKEKTPVALLVLRVDQFEKMLNPNLVLNELKVLIQHLIREKDVLLSAAEGRMILLLSNTTAEFAQKIAATMKEKIGLKLSKEPLTVSIAISSLEASQKGFSKMVDSAIKSFKAHSETNLIISLDPEIS